MQRTIRVYIVLYDCDGPGTMGDGLAQYRTRKRDQAEAFAVGRTTYGAVAGVQEHDVPRAVARRWGLA